MRRLDDRSTVKRHNSWGLPAARATSWWPFSGQFQPSIDLLDPQLHGTWNQQPQSGDSGRDQFSESESRAKFTDWHLTRRSFLFKPSAGFERNAAAAAATAAFRSDRQKFNHQSRQHQNVDARTQSHPARSSLRFVRHEQGQGPRCQKERHVRHVVSISFILFQTWKKKKKKKKEKSWIWIQLSW